MILLDTHILIWALSAPDRLSPRQHAALTDPTERVMFSAVSIWEVAIKAQRHPNLPFRAEDLARAARQTGFDELKLDAASAFVLHDLPPHHADPFDRMLIAQAIEAQARLATQDDAIRRYAPLLRILD